MEPSLSLPLPYRTESPHWGTLQQFLQKSSYNSGEHKQLCPFLLSICNDVSLFALSHTLRHFLPTPPHATTAIKHDAFNSAATQGKTFIQYWGTTEPAISGNLHIPLFPTSFFFI